MQFEIYGLHNNAKHINTFHDNIIFQVIFLDQKKNILFNVNTTYCLYISQHLFTQIIEETQLYICLKRKVEFSTYRG